MFIMYLLLVTLAKLCSLANDPCTDKMGGLKPLQARVIYNESFLLGQQRVVSTALDVPLGHGFIGVKKSWDDASSYVSLRHKSRHAAVCKRLGVDPKCLRALKKKKNRYVWALACFTTTGSWRFFIFVYSFRVSRLRKIPYPRKDAQESISSSRVHVCNVLLWRTCWRQPLLTIRVCKNHAIPSNYPAISTRVDSPTSDSNSWSKRRFHPLRFEFAKFRFEMRGGNIDYGMHRFLPTRFIRICKMCKGRCPHLQLRFVLMY